MTSKMVLISNPILPKIGPSGVEICVSFCLCFSVGSDQRYARANAIETQLFISDLLSRIVLFDFNSGSTSGPKGFQF